MTTTTTTTTIHGHSDFLTNAIAPWQAGSPNSCSISMRSATGKVAHLPNAITEHNIIATAENQSTSVVPRHRPGRISD